ncbi:hypothetical protein OROGR_019719 [Orobanche gracilis]
MPRCVNNCYNLDSFWKNWHASFNEWLVRYVYIPFGGSQKKMLNVWVIFTFVAVWHDLECLFHQFQEAYVLGLVDMYIFYTRTACKISGKCLTGRLDGICGHVFGALACEVEALGLFCRMTRF